MKCSACGAPVENGVCTYCGKKYSEKQETNTETAPKVKEEPKVQAKEIAEEVIGRVGPEAEKVAKKKGFWKTVGLVLLWITFLPILLSIYIWRSEKLSKNAKIVILVVMWLLFIIVGVVENRNADVGSVDSQIGQTTISTTASDTSVDSTTAVAGTTHIYDNAEIKNQKNANGKPLDNKVSVITVQKDSVTNEVLQDWFENYVLKDEYMGYWIVYEGSSPLQGIYGNKNQVQQDVTLKENEQRVYDIEATYGSTFYTVDNGKLIASYTEPTKAEAEQIVSTINGFIDGSFKGTGYAIDVAGDARKMDANLILVPTSSSDYKGATEYVVNHIREKKLPIGYLSITYQDANGTILAIASVDDVSNYSGANDIKIQK